MNVPNLPTDNLYKFIALSGVAFALACGGLIGLRDVQLLESYTENVVAIKALELQQKVATDSLNAINTSLENRKTPPTDEEFTRDFVPLFEDVSRLQREVIEQGRALLPRSADLAAQAMVLYRWRNQLVYGFWSGVGVAVVGFMLWYFKLQRYQDMIVKKQALEAKKET